MATCASRRRATPVAASRAGLSCGHRRTMPTMIAARAPIEMVVRADRSCAARRGCITCWPLPQPPPRHADGHHPRTRRDGRPLRPPPRDACSCIPRGYRRATLLPHYGVLAPVEMRTQCMATQSTPMGTDAARPLGAAGCCSGAWRVAGAMDSKVKDK